MKVSGHDYDLVTVSCERRAMLISRKLLASGTKLAQAKKFNDPDDPCKILVATDAIGMGLNL